MWKAFAIADVFVLFLFFSLSSSSSLHLIFIPYVYMNWNHYCTVVNALRLCCTVKCKWISFVSLAVVVVLCVCVCVLLVCFWLLLRLWPLSLYTVHIHTHSNNIIVIASFSLSFFANFILRISYSIKLSIYYIDKNLPFIFSCFFPLFFLSFHVHNCQFAHQICYGWRWMSKMKKNYNQICNRNINNINKNGN